MKTKATISIFIGILFITIAIYAPVRAAEVSVNIGIGMPAPQVIIPAPPPVVIYAPPPVIVIPGTYVYFAADISVDIFFYHGYWYRPHHGHWYRASDYYGPWHNIRDRRVPHVVRNLPPDFRHSVQHRERIRHDDLTRNWKTWEKKKHWDRHDYQHQDSRDYKLEAQGGHDEKRWGKSDSRPSSKYEGWEVRDIRDDRGMENGQNKPERREKHGR